MSDVVQGWYTDPAGGAGQRWWDGGRWTEHIRPAGGYQPQGFQPGYGQQLPYSQVGSMPDGRSLLRRNRYTGITVLIGIAYVLLAFAVHIVLIGILPILFAVRAFRAREKLAPLAAVAAGLSVVLALLLLAH